MSNDDHYSFSVFFRLGFAIVNSDAPAISDTPAIINQLIDLLHKSKK